ncbi:hypothetical protein B0J12DRAFT_664480 [Macrophomina phaseolina]|uniref:Uncharacterized protein n=1 Tax=Macrophomina phaseolina TaxID=35725 RepID=A0ABQ8G9H1_9PEZI|nr:hypothetical protein B0J12DRAFT_664480 [Macrophomina phaseolina]
MGAWALWKWRHWYLLHLALPVAREGLSGFLLIDSNGRRRLTSNPTAVLGHDTLLQADQPDGAIDGVLRFPGTSAGALEGGK